jgi:hypothetical protein
MGLGKNRAARIKHCLTSGFEYANTSVGNRLARFCHQLSVMLRSAGHTEKKFILILEQLH